MKKAILLFIIFFCTVSCTWLMENHNNPYDFTVTKPDLKEIVGEYHISEKSRKRLNIPKKIADTIGIKINSNKTFEFKNMPENEVFKNIESFRTTNQKGKWSMEISQDSWVLAVNIISQYDKTSEYIANQYHLNHNEPPYQILKMAGDENWEAIEFEKK